VASLSAEKIRCAKKAELCEHDLSQCKQELDQNKMDLDQNRRELNQQKIKFDVVVAELAKEHQLRQVAEHRLLQCERGQTPVPFQGNGGTVPTVEMALPVFILENNTMRTDSTNTSIAGTSTNTIFPAPMASARQEEVSSSSSFLEPPSKSVVIAPRRLSITTVTTEAELTTALNNNARIELAADILLTSTININGLTGVVIDGKGFEINGNDTVRCFYIYNGAEVSLSNLTITRGYTTGVSRRERTRPLLILLYFLPFFQKTNDVLKSAFLRLPPPPLFLSQLTLPSSLLSSHPLRAFDFLFRRQHPLPLPPSLFSSFYPSFSFFPYT
jgi:hypothetical protein